MVVNNDKLVYTVYIVPLLDNVHHRTTTTTTLSKLSLWVFYMATVVGE